MLGRFFLILSVSLRCARELQAFRVFFGTDIYNRFLEDGEEILYDLSETLED